MDNLTKLVLATYEGDVFLGLGVRGILNKKAKDQLYVNGLHQLYFREGLQQWIAEVQPFPVPMFCEHFVVGSVEEQQAVVNELFSIIQNEKSTVERLKKTVEIYFRTNCEGPYPGDYLHLTEDGLQAVPFRQIVPEDKDGANEKGVNENYLHLMSATPSNEIASHLDLRLLSVARIFFGNKYMPKFFSELDWQGKIFSSEKSTVQEYAALMDAEDPIVAQEIRDYLNRVEIIDPRNQK